jgi:hypothetical protein
MARRLITFLSSVAIVASLSLSPAYAQSHGGDHRAATPQTQPVTHSGETHSGGTHSGETHSPKAPMTVAQRIDAHPQLVTRLTPLLPSGMTIDQAAAGFKNQGQFIAALHVSKDLNIPFDQLKAAVTGPDHVSLGKAIQQLKPTANAKAEVKLAETETHADLKAAKPDATKKVDTDKDDDKGKDGR